jgi:D-3-phosphoglycerate dehydrogenase
MEKEFKSKVVLNLESKDYSKLAIKKWELNGYIYKEIESQSFLDYNEVEIIIVRLANYINKDILAPFVNLKFIISATTGIDHIDLPHLKKKDIELISLSKYPDFLQSITSTGEHTWGLLLSLIRKIPLAYNDVLKGNWQRDNFKGIQLKGKKIGIIGLGRVGLQVAKFASAFELEVFYYDPNVNNELFNKVSQLADLFCNCDVISVHIHLNLNTQHLISDELINRTINGFYLLNTSRGAIIDEPAIIRGLKKGSILGFAGDVLDGEINSISNNLLLEEMKSGVSNIIITPHIGGATFDAMWACEEFLSDKIFYYEKN